MKPITSRSSKDSHRMPCQPISLDSNVGFCSSATWARLLKYVALGLGIAYLSMYVILALIRMNYPFHLEWLESGTLKQIQRLLDGDHLYVSPSLDFVPGIYTPLYYYVSTALSLVTGTGFFAPRLVSILSSLGIFLLIALVVRKETRSWYAGILAAGLFAASYRIGGTWFDVARVDSLFLFLLLWSLYLVRFSTTPAAYIFSGLIMTLSFLTKQSALPVALAAAVYGLMVGPRLALYYIITLVVLVGGSTLWLNALHQGWYCFYVFEIPSGHPWLENVYTDFWTKDLFSRLPVACLLAVGYFCGWPRGRRKRAVLFYLLTTIGMLGSTWVSRLHELGWDNVLMPAYALLAILFGLTVPWVLRLARRGRGKPRSRAEVFVHLCCVIQFVLLYYNPREQLPTQADREAGSYLVQKLSQIPGEIYIPCHSYLATLAGKQSHAQWYTVLDVLRSKQKDIADQVYQEIDLAFREQRFSVIVLDDSGPELEIGEDYRLQELLFEGKLVFWPVTGFKTRPHRVFVSRRVDSTE